MSISSSDADKTTKNVTKTDARQYYLQEVGGPAVIGRDVTVRFTDEGAVKAGIGAAKHATTEALDFGRAALGVIYDVQSQATGSQRRAVEAMQDTTSEALAYVDAANRGEGARNVETLIKWGAAAALAAFVVPPLVTAMAKG